MSKQLQGSHHADEELPVIFSQLKEGPAMKHHPPLYRLGLADVPNPNRMPMKEIKSAMKKPAQGSQGPLKDGKG